MADMNQTVDKFFNTADYTESFHPQDTTSHPRTPSKPGADKDLLQNY